MKTMTIWQRLNTTLVLLVILLLTGVGLAVWVAETRSSAVQRSDQLSAAKDRISYDLALMSDAVHAVLMQPANDAERRRRREAEVELKYQLEGMQRAFSEYTELIGCVRSLRDFAFGALAGFYDEIFRLCEQDPAAARDLYSKHYADLKRQRDQLLRDLTQQVDRARGVESLHAQRTAVAGLSSIVVILLASAVVGRVQSAAVTGPLKRVVASLERMRQGDFTERLPVTRKDEFGVLSEGINRLADDLSGLVGQVQRSGIQVNMTATEIAATARDQQSTAHEIAATTAEIGATSRQISATSKELERTMNEVSQVAEETAHSAGSGQEAIARMEAHMSQIMQASGSITAKLSVLNEKTANINSVVTTITKVADQTNLLSLNAAIEAEKAGEYGLGFAVVAMEIRRLADQTAVATYDIEKMVKEMQAAVAAGVMSMDKFSQEVRRGVDEIRHVGAQLAQIIHQVQTLTPRFQTVNEGMHAQAAGAAQISETLTQLGEAVHQTAESLRQSNLAIEQLNGAARALQTSVARFKLAP
jgi:methyl-accepting chemotaxis protein WspA